MSHFPVLVVGDDIDDQLDPYDENQSVLPYLDSLHGQWRAALTGAQEYVVQKTQAVTTGWSALDYLNAYYGEGYWVPAKDGSGEFEHWSTYNPKSKHDWYVTGGRWDGFLVTRDGEKTNQCTVADIDLDTLEIPFALVKDSQWYEKGVMGWWAMVSEEKTDASWEAEVRAALKDLPGDTKLTLVDCHI